MACFVLPRIPNNPDGWGPSGLPEQFKDMPYQPFSKADRLGKVCLYCVPLQISEYHTVTLLAAIVADQIALTDRWRCLELVQARCSGGYKTFCELTK